MRIRLIASLFVLLAATARAALVCTPATIAVGQSAVVEVRLDVGAAVLGSYSAALSYDPATVTFTTIAGGSTPEFAGMPTSNASVAGTVLFNAFQTSPTAPTGVVSVARVTVTGKAAAANSALMLAVRSAFDANAAPIPGVTGGACTLTVQGQATSTTSLTPTTLTSTTRAPTTTTTAATTSTTRPTTTTAATTSTSTVTTAPLTTTTRPPPSTTTTMAPAPTTTTRVSPTTSTAAPPTTTTTTTLRPTTSSTVTPTTRAPTTSTAPTTPTTRTAPPATSTTLAPCAAWHAPCVTDAQCCSGKCRYRPRFGRRVCVLLPSPGDGDHLPRTSRPAP